MTQRCETCRYWNAYGYVRGECRRNPPFRFERLTSSDRKAWPETEKTDWCGEFQAKQEGVSQ